MSEESQEHLIIIRPHISRKISQSNNAAAKTPSYLSFGWKRAPLLAAFFNGALLMALALSVFVQSVERVISLHRLSTTASFFSFHANVQANNNYPRRG